MLIECSNISKMFHGNNIIKNATFKIRSNDKISIIGVNGAGKSTLLNILAKKEEYDSGTIFESKELTIGYLEQQHTFDLNKTVYQAALEVFDDLIDIENKIRILEQQMKELHDEKIYHEYDILVEKFKALDGYFYNSKLDAVLKGLGFSQNDFNLQICSLSGGQKTRLALARLLLKQPKLLLLDEPTNHLDKNAIQFFEDYLRNYPHAVVIVSHDRYFINQVSKRIIELEHGKTTIYDTNYENYSILKKQQRSSELKQYINQQKEIKKIEQSIQTLKSFNREKSVKRADSKQKNLDKIEKLDRPESLPSEIRLSFCPKCDTGYDVLSINNLSVNFGEPLFQNINLNIHKGDKIAIIGDNGVGKTTLLKAIMKNIAYNGTIKIGSRVEIGYYDQEHSSLSLNNSIFQEIHDSYPSLNNTEIRNTLALFNFINEDVNTQISNLSGGERGRVLLSKLLLKKANFLLLDEPTNHLDIQSKEVLEDALSDFQGTVLFISHDRYFIDKIATHVVELKNNGIIKYDGNYEYYLSKVFINETNSKNEAISDNKKSQVITKQQRNELKKTEKEITILELELNQLKNELLKEEVINDYIAYNKITENIEKLELELLELMGIWENLN